MLDVGIKIVHVKWCVHDINAMRHLFDVVVTSRFTVSVYSFFFLPVLLFYDFTSHFLLFSMFFSFIIIFFSVFISCVLVAVFVSVCQLGYKFSVDVCNDNSKNGNPIQCFFFFLHIFSSTNVVLMLFLFFFTISCVLFKISTIVEWHSAWQKIYTITV